MDEKQVIMDFLKWGKPRGIVLAKYFDNQDPLIEIDLRYLHQVFKDYLATRSA